ncbi:MAG: amidohydrolase [Nanoarchaeota archaeon]|nr:amidohydrolase [Nanoarchaeota archaeon]MBU4456186.1 amidohydrolase [Nanoarchaeota archaeon]MCG2719992.1 amidohydrolase [Nanoarchaeota archaeon]
MNFNVNNRKIFDAHSHVGKFGPRTMKHNVIDPFKGREINSLEELEAYKKRLGIYFMLITPNYAPEQELAFGYNDLVLEALSLEGIYGALWVSPLPENKEMNDKVLNLLPHDKIVALKISPDSWPKGKYTPRPSTWDALFKENMIKILETAKKYNLVIHMHTGSNNSGIYQYMPFVEEYGRGVKIHFVHMGSSAGGHMMFVPLFIKWLQEGYDFYCDTSMCKGFGPNWLVQELLEHYPSGLDRVLFASDNPWGLFESEFWRIEAMNCTNEIKDKIFYSNALKLYINR